MSLKFRCKVTTLPKKRVCILLDTLHWILSFSLLRQTWEWQQNCVTTQHTMQCIPNWNVKVFKLILKTFYDNHETCRILANLIYPFILLWSYWHKVLVSGTCSLVIYFIGETQFDQNIKKIEKPFLMKKSSYFTWSPAASNGIITVVSLFLQSDTRDLNTSLIVVGGEAFFLKDPSKHMILLYGLFSGNSFDHQHDQYFLRSSSLFLASSLTLIERSLNNAPMTDAAVGV